MTIESDFPSSIGAVARRELAVHGITGYDRLVRLTARDLLALHGVGPKAARILTAELARRGLRLSD